MKNKNFQKREKMDKNVSKHAYIHIHMKLGEE
jgi:hypothetical protein